MPQVIVALPMQYGYYRDVVLGVARYAGLKWRLILSDGVGPDRLDDLVALGVRGFILTVFDDVMAPALRNKGIPAINVSGRLDHPGLATVRPDDVAIGRLAARHLLDRGHTRLGCPVGGLAFAARRCEGFLEVAREAGVETFQMTGADFARVEVVREFPKPTGLFLPTDMAASSLVGTCHQAGVRIPDDLAVVGVDNDSVYALSSTPALTTVDPAADVVGFTAAAELDRLITRHARHSSSRKTILIPPRGIVARASSDLIYVSDDLVARAVRHIREHACSGLSVEMVADTFTVSRRTLERRFRRQFGTSMLEAIRKVQMDHARDLLNHTDLTVADVASRCGFSEARNFITRFKRDEGVPPGLYRKQRRMG